MVTCSTNEAGQLAEQLGGPKRDSPSNNPLWVPHKVGMIWLGRKTWLVAMLSISCQKEQVTCRIVLKKALVCLGGTCSFTKSDSWVWMFRKARSVCHRAAIRAGSRISAIQGKTGATEAPLLRAGD